MENLKEVPKKDEAPVAVVEPKKNTASGPKEQVKSPEKKTEKHGKFYEVNIVRDFYGKADPFYISENIHKDPDYAYRFLRDDTKSGAKNISIKTSNLLFAKGGWQIASKDFLLSREKYLGLGEKDFAPDGFLRRGDTILAFMPKSLFREKQADKQKKANEAINVVKRNIKRGDPSVAGVGHPDMLGLQTAKQLGMK